MVKEFPFKRILKQLAVHFDIRLDEGSYPVVKNEWQRYFDGFEVDDQILDKAVKFCTETMKYAPKPREFKQAILKQMNKIEVKPERDPEENLDPEIQTGAEIIRLLRLRYPTAAQKEIMKHYMSAISDAEKKMVGKSRIDILNFIKNNMGVFR